ncbi:MAG: hypothetical protein IPJ67_02155 [Candidatus Moraniibacteriota bacterium]|nr:MAG: hypothetical protein IPJ67_02155 [Candidatus Moranbacteria bacterium]
MNNLSYRDLSYLSIDAKPILLCDFGGVVYSPVPWENLWLRPFLVREGLVVLKDGIPYTRDVVYFDFASGRGIESLKRHLRECAGDYSLVFCLFFPNPPPNPFPVLHPTIPIKAFHLYSKRNYQQVFPVAAYRQPSHPVASQGICVQDVMRRAFFM